MKLDYAFVIKTSLLYCALAASFSFLGIFLPEKGPQGNPILSLTVQEVGGHIIWGLVAATVTLSARYILLGGALAVLIDSDHLVGLLHIPAISRMSHSIVFGLFASLVLIIIFGKRDYRLGAVAFAGMLAHLSYDTFAGEDGKFPIFAPFYNSQISFAHIDWLYFEVAAIILVGIATILTKKQLSEKLAN